jgi:quinol-cytochrome oxidoreductase complex cytochrome b subunit
MTEKQITKDKTQEIIPFYPDHVRTELKVVYGIVAIVLVFGVLGLIFPVGLQPPADPYNTPAHVKPEWYFLALYQLLKFIPKTIGATAPVIALVILALWPFFDRKQETTPRNTKIRLWATVVFVIVAIALTIWGEVA